MDKLERPKNFHGYLIQGWSGYGDDAAMEDEQFSSSPLEAQKDVAAFFRAGHDYVKIHVLLKGESGSYITQEDALGAIDL